MKQTMLEELWGPDGRSDISRN